MNFPERIRLAVKTQTGKDSLGKPIYSTTYHPARASVVLVNAKEDEGVFAVTDVSIRVPASFPLLDTVGQVVVDSGPLVGTYNVNASRPNRHHTRYIGRRVIT